MMLLVSIFGGDPDNVPIVRGITGALTIETLNDCLHRIAADIR